MKHILLLFTQLISLTLSGQVGRLPYQIIRQTYRGDTVDTKLGTSNVEYTTNLDAYDFNKQLIVRDTSLLALIKKHGGGGSSAGIQDITYSNLIAAISGGTLVPGTLYRITDRGDMALYFRAVSANKLEVDGVRIMLCPAVYDITLDAYSNNWIGIWKSTLTPVANDLVIWGGKVWKNNAGNVGATMDDITLNSEWTLITKAGFTNHEYVQMVFGCHYSWTNDFVTKQWDNHDNVFVYDNNFDSYNNCDISDWNWSYNGARTFYSNHCRGVYNNDIVGIYEISMNSNNGVIKNNFAPLHFIIDNNNNGNISGNSCSSTISGNSCSGGIEDNSNLGEIRNNSNKGVISTNTNSGSIEANTNGSYIQSNSNSGDILRNSNNERILNNSNSDAIQWNSNSGSIDGNSNEGYIQLNNNRGDINGNTNLGIIEINSNNGGIINCSSGANPCDIFHNINNGNISGTYSANVSDPVVDK